MAQSSTLPLSFRLWQKEQETLASLPQPPKPQTATEATSYKPYGACAELHDCTLPEVLISGRAGTGKSLACLTKLDRAAREYPKSRYLIVRKTRASLSESGLVTFERDVLGVEHPWVVNGPQRQYRQRYSYDNGAEIVVGGLDKPGRVLSTEYDLVYVQQAEELQEGDWQVLLTRLRSGQTPYQQLMACANPAGPTHWLKKRCDAKVTHYLEGQFRDNPKLWDREADDWTDEGRDYFAKLNLLTGTLRSRLLEGQWVQAEGVVYDNFGQLNVCDDEPDPDLPTELGYDDGYIDPRVFLFIQRTATKVLIFDEMYHTHHLAQTCVGEMVDTFRDWPWPLSEDEQEDKERRAEILAEQQAGSRRLLPEMAVGGSESKELQQQFRIMDIPARGGTHRPITEGIEIVRRLVCDGQGYRTLQVNRRCKNFIGEMTEGYVYPSTSARGKADVPIDANNHGPDAFRTWAFLRARR